MKTELALITLLALAGILFFNNTQQQNSEAQLYERFENWKREHGEIFEGTENDYRFSVFLSNLAYIETYNAEHSGVTLGLNKFACLTNQEYQQRVLSKKRTNKIVTDANSDMNPISPNASSINWTQKGDVTPVGDQGKCGSCWAWGSTSQLESLHAINSGNLQSFSVQQVCSCVGPAGYDSDGCNGGWETDGFAYVSKYGIETNADYPYVQKNNPKTAPCQYDKNKVVFYNKGYKEIAPNRPDLMQNQLMSQTLSIGVNASAMAFQLYTSGILEKGCGKQVDHAVSLTGMDLDNSTPYWIIKNSWGTSWGQKGYINIAISSGSGICGCQSDVSYPTL